LWLNKKIYVVTPIEMPCLWACCVIFP
jgi:hypothetical protein